MTPRKYILDSNIYIGAFRDSVKADAMDRFLERCTPRTYMSAVVMQELRAGAITDAQAKILEEMIFAPFERLNRVTIPTMRAYKECGRILAALYRQDGIAYRERPRSLVNDILIAASCREGGLTLVTEDSDFKTIRPYLRGFNYIAPWPSGP